jgi:hypothetical protein
MNFLTLAALSSTIIFSSCSNISKNSSANNSNMLCPIDTNIPTKLWETGGFSGPESVVYDHRTKKYFVSNVAGGPLDKDKNGWISSLNNDGSISKLKWLKSSKIHAPKGMRIKKNNLWFSDIDQVVSVSIPRRRIVKRISIDGSKFLNDVDYSIKTGSIYVTDMFTNKIHVVSKSSSHATYLESKELENPNGIAIRANEMVVASWGPGIKDDFSTEKPGKILSINLKSKVVSNWTDLRLGNLDGIEFVDKNTIIVSDWKAGKVFKVKKSGTCTTLLTGFKGSADLTYIPSKNIIVIPLMLENKVVAYKL